MSYKIRNVHSIIFSCNMLRGKVLKRMWTFFCTSANISAFITASGLHHFRITHTTTPLLVTDLPDAVPPTLAGPHARCSILQRFNNYYQFTLRTRCYFLWLLLLLLLFLSTAEEIVSLQYRWPIWWANAGNRLRGTLIYRCISLSLLLCRIIYHNNIMCY